MSENLITLIDETNAITGTDWMANSMSASRWHQCDRAMWLKYHNARNPNLPGRIGRLMRFGHIMEPVFCEWLYKVGIEVVNRESKTSIGLIDGMAFIDDAWWLVEFKTANDRNFKKIAKAQNLADSKPEYYAQTQLYMHHSPELSKKDNRLEKCLFFVMNKNDHSLYIEVVDYDSNYAEQQAARIEQLKVEERLPPQTVEDWQCKFCDYKGICKDTEVPYPSCGTCASWSPDGCKFGDQECERHVYHPDLMELVGYNYTDVDQNNMAIQYGEFWNGGAHIKQSQKGAVFTSRELYAMTQEQREDETLLNIVNKLGASVEC